MYATIKNLETIMNEKAKHEICELRTKETISAGDYLLEAVMQEGKDKNTRSSRLVRMLDDGLICYQTDQPDKVLWTVLMEHGNRFELLFTHSVPIMSGQAAQRNLPSGVKLVVGSERTYYIHHAQQQIIKKLCGLLAKKINQLGFKSLFRPLKKIGKGNFGSVYMAECIEDGRKVAVKAFSKEASYSQQKGRESLVNEIAMLRKVSHPNIVELIGVFESDNSLYMVMENLDGGHLMSKFQANYSFSQGEVKHTMSGLLKGLAHLSSRRIMHRDLKPENLLFRGTGKNSEIVIADFGLAANVDAEQHLFVRCGTPGYVAPEVINIVDMKTKTDPICDVFSAGIIMHMLLLGRSVFNGKTYDKILVENRACDFKLEGADYAKLDVEAMDLMSRMLKVEPKDRVSAAAALRHPYLVDKSAPILRPLSVQSLSPTEQVKPTTQSDLRRKNSCFPSAVSNQSTNSNLNVRTYIIRELRNEDKQNMFVSTKPEQTSIIRKKVRS